MACFLYLFLAVAVNYKDDNPTAWTALRDGRIGMCVFSSMLWLIYAMLFGAFAALVFGILKQLLRKAH